MQQLIIALALFFSVTANAIDTDIRLLSQLSSFETQKEFALSVSDCTVLSHIVHESVNFPVSEAIRLPNSQVGCQFVGIKQLIASQGSISIDIYKSDGSLFNSL